MTTCPVPEGYPKAGELDENGRAPGRTRGVMEKFINPWAKEVISKHSDISVCDHYQFVVENRETIYSEWWSGGNVHFDQNEGEALGNFLADHVADVMNLD